MIDEPQIDPLASTVEQLAKHEIVCIAPVLKLCGDLLEDANRQYDRDTASVLTQVRRKLVERLWQGTEVDTVQAAARIVHRPEGTVRYWCREGLVTARKVGARGWEIDRESLFTRAAA